MEHDDNAGRRQSSGGVLFVFTAETTTGILMVNKHRNILSTQNWLKVKRASTNILVNLMLSDMY